MTGSVPTTSRSSRRSWSSNEVDLKSLKILTDVGPQGAGSGLWASQAHSQLPSRSCDARTDACRGSGRPALAHRLDGRAAAVDRDVLRSGGVHGPFHAPRPRGAAGADPDLSQGLWRRGRTLRRPCRPVPGGRTADLLRLAQGSRGRRRARGARGPGDRAGGQRHSRGVQALGPRGPDHRNRRGGRAIPRRQHRGEAGRRGGTRISRPA